MAYATNTFPTDIQDPVKPIATDEVLAFDHAGLETFQNASIKALKDKVGANSSGVTTSHDYKLSEVSDKAIGKTAVQTLENKKLVDTTTKIVDSADPTIEIAFDADGTTGTKTTLKTSQTTNKTVTIPDITDTLVTKDTTDALKNKTITDASNVVTANKLRTATTEVVVSTATAPTVGQVLTALNGTSAEWQTPAITPALQPYTLEKASITYDAQGRIATVTDTNVSPSVVYTLTYDAQDSLETVTDTVSTWTVTYTNDQVTNISKV